MRVRRVLSPLRGGVTMTPRQRLDAVIDEMRSNRHHSAGKTLWRWREQLEIVRAALEQSTRQRESESESEF